MECQHGMAQPHCHVWGSEGPKFWDGSAYRHSRCAPGAWQAWEASEPLPKEGVEKGRKARWEMLLC